MVFSSELCVFTQKCLHVFFVTQDYVSVFYQDAENAEVSGTSTTDVEGEYDDDFEDEDDVDEVLQQAIENSILSLDAEDQGAAPLYRYLPLRCVNSLYLY